MDFAEMIQAMQEKLTASGSVKNVYGEAVQSGGKTVIPVAKIGYGFGGGTGGREEGRGGSGAGGGVGARPAGVFEISEAGTRFIPADAGRQLAIAAAAGFIFGFLFAKIRQR
ncbi:MAG: spore germination protein GerW family protein [Rhodospirillales bacterium]